MVATEEICAVEAPLVLPPVALAEALLPDREGVDAAPDEAALPEALAPAVAEAELPAAVLDGAGRLV